MDATTPWLIESVFLFSSSLSILGRAFAAAPLLAFIYLLFLLAYASGCVKLRTPNPSMFHYPLSIINLFIFCTLQLNRFSHAQDATLTTTLRAGTPTSFRSIFTVPSSADVGTYNFPACLPVSDRFTVCKTCSESKRLSIPLRTISLPKDWP